MDMKKNNEKSVRLRDHIAGIILKILSEPDTGYIV